MPAPVARPILGLAVADGLALVAFVLMGVDHHTSGTAANVIRTAGPLLVAWYAVGAIVGAYRRPGVRTLAGTWILALPVGAVLRSLVRGGPWDDRLLVFAGVALGFSGLFLVAGRSVVAAMTWYMGRRSRVASGS